MKNNKVLKILVYPSMAAKRPLLERILYLESLDGVPYNNIVSSLQFLFGDKSVILFHNEILPDMTCK